MKTILSAALLAFALTAATGANAEGHVTDPLLVDLAQSGKSLSPHGIWTGR